jgi:hypothetical protein
LARSAPFGGEAASAADALSTAAHETKMIVRLNIATPFLLSSRREDAGRRENLRYAALFRKVRHAKSAAFPPG